MNQTVTTAASQKMTGSKDRLYIDLLTSSLFAHLSSIWLGYSQKHQLPPALEKNHHQLQQAIGNFRTNVDNFVPEVIGKDFFRGHLSNAVLYDISLLIETMVRISKEEDRDFYIEFSQMIFKLVDDIFYSAKNRGHIKFSKYKAIFALIREELKADVDGVPGRIDYKDRELSIRLPNNTVHTQEVHV